MKSVNNVITVCVYAKNRYDNDDAISGVNNINEWVLAQYYLSPTPLGSGTVAVLTNEEGWATG